MISTVAATPSDRRKHFLARPQVPQEAVHHQQCHRRQPQQEVRSKVRCLRVACGEHRALQKGGLPVVVIGGGDRRRVGGGEVEVMCVMRGDKVQEAERGGKMKRRKGGGGGGAEREEGGGSGKRERENKQM